MKIYMIVHGFVQGVGYRSLVKHTAEKYSIKGMTKNMPDGSVSIFAEADKETLERFEKEIFVDIKNGPQVHNIEKYDEGNEKFPKDLHSRERFIIERS